MRKKATYGKTMKAKSGKKLTAKAAKKRSVRNKAGKKAVAKSKKMGYGGKAASMVPSKSKMKAKAGKKVKKAQAGMAAKLLKKIANNKKVLSKMKSTKKGPKLTPKQKEEILESYYSVGDTKAIRAKRKTKTKKLSREEELTNSYNTPRRVKPKSKMKKAKSGLKKPKPSQKGLKKLPKAVRNKMGYAKKGKKVVKKAQAGGVARKSKKAPMVDPKGAWTKVQERTIAGKKYKKAKAGCKTRKK